MNSFSSAAVILDERSRSAIEIDPELAELRQRQRDQHLYTFLVPRLRVLGVILLGLTVFLHNRVLGGSDQAALVFTAMALVYAALSWGVLRGFYSRLLPFDLAYACLIADLALLVAAIYASGGEASWLMVVLLLRTADQATASFRRAAFFAHATVAAYLVLLIYLAWGEGRPIDWGVELMKLLLLYSGNLYLVAIARFLEHQRHKVSAKVEMARTGIRRMEMNAVELEEARARAEAASAAKSQFLAHVSQEVRSPMNELLGISDMLLLDSLTHEQREWIEILRTSGGNLLTIIDAILDLAKIEAGELIPDSVLCDLRQLAEGVVKPFVRRAKEGGVELVCEVDAGVPETVRTDPIRLRQVLTNLVSNAVKFTNSGRIHVRVGVEEVFDASRSRVCFEVEDTGVGIPLRAQPYLFEPFTQRSDMTRRGHKGSGLSLVITQRLVELMGGEIEVESTPGKGSRFFFLLSLETVFGSAAPSAWRESAGKQPQKPQPAPSESSVGKRILLVEDEEVSRLVGDRLLKSFGFEVATAANGREALKALDNEHFDLVIMDCQMPIVDGYEATREIRRREKGSTRHTPILALTSQALTGDRERCLAAGMDDYIPKPLSRGMLADVLSSWVEIDDSP